MRVVDAKDIKSIDNFLLNYLDKELHINKKYLLYHVIYSDNQLNTILNILETKKIDPRIKGKNDGMGGNKKYLFTKTYIDNLRLMFGKYNIIFKKKLLFEKKSYWTSGWRGGDHIKEYTTYHPNNMNYNIFRKDIDKEIKEYYNIQRDSIGDISSSVMSHEILFKTPIDIDYIKYIIIYLNNKLYIFTPKTKIENIIKIFS